MIRSMTGFGEAQVEEDGIRLRVEIRSVNHRHLNSQVRLPRGSEALEPRVQAWIREALSRGHVSVTITTDGPTGSQDSVLPRFDLERARSYQALFTRMKDELGLPGEVDLGMMIRFRDLFTEPQGEEASPTPVPEGLLRTGMEAALAALVAHREREGRSLEKDMEARSGAMEAALTHIRERAPERLIRERDRLREAVRVLAEREEVDEERLAREIAHLAERWDIHEEVVRLGGHLMHFRETMAGGDDEAVGKRLGFLVQEMHRETNTIGAKANDAEIARRVIGLKEELERLREQLENVE